MSLLEDNHLMISNGNHTIYVTNSTYTPAYSDCILNYAIAIILQESLSLWDAKKWIRGVTKGDTALFIYRMNVCANKNDRSV